ncbi:hypothetical protein EVAR_20187_1 [Eumeta japonica]|uniref:Uncharacterized protein n=1 Tax=Eumeta variegata TaxID=151549 RepID=A0A4C1UTU5_EUMVA|nr:hypothetical protein EVAR_20187_1 [Eumeta japonica]
MGTQKAWRVSTAHRLKGTCSCLETATDIARHKSAPGASISPLIPNRRRFDAIGTDPFRGSDKTGYRPEKKADRDPQNVPRRPDSKLLMTLLVVNIELTACRFGNSALRHRATTAITDNTRFAAITKPAAAAPVGVSDVGRKETLVKREPDSRGRRSVARLISFPPRLSRILETHKNTRLRNSASSSARLLRLVLFSRAVPARGPG